MTQLLLYYICSNWQRHILLNKNQHLKNEVMFIIDKLLNEGILNKDQHENIYKEFIKK